MAMLEYQDATDSPDQRIDYPEHVEGFEALGFQRIGRILAMPTETTLENLAAGYGDRADEYLEHAYIPTPILRAPDQSAFVEVSWFWDSPSIRIRTTLDDGSLVETLRRWENPPPAGPMQQHWRNVDVDAAMTAAHAPAGGRSIEVVAGCSPDEQWLHHRAHVARYAAARRARPVEHSDLATCLEQYHSTFSHSIEVVRAGAGMWRPLVHGYAGLGFLAIAALVVWSFVASGRGDNGAPYFIAAIAVALFFASTMLPFVRLVISRVRTAPKRLRPDLVLDDRSRPRG